MMAQGLNVKRLIAYRLATIAVPPNGNVFDGLSFLTSKDKIVAGTKEATKWVEQAIATVKAAPNNPYGDNDEAIAGEILRQVDVKRGKIPTGAVR